MYILHYSKKAVQDLKKLETNVAKRILDKLKTFNNTENPLFFAKQLKNVDPKIYRFRVGHYRVIFEINKKGEINILHILRIKHRKDIYKF